MVEEKTFIISPNEIILEAENKQEAIERAINMITKDISTIFPLAVDEYEQ